MPAWLPFRRLLAIPVDGDARAAYGILDTEANSFEHRRVTYPVSVTQDKLKAYDFPERLWKRLAFGW